MIRDRAFVSQKYERIWGGVRDFARGLQAEGALDFESAFHRTLEFSHGTAPAGMFAPMAAAPSPFLIGGREVPLAPLALEWVWRDLVSQEVFRAMRRDADLVVELGSGWSPNIFNLWLRGSPPGAAYFGGEWTEGGREAATALAGFRPSMRFAAPPFDWSHPDFGFVPRDTRHATIFSCYSIEQIPELGADALRGMLQALSGAQSVQGVFIEPVGWQFPEFAPDRSITERQRAYIRDHNYNTNLRRVMEILGEERRIEILGLAVDTFGSSVNPGTVIHWRRI